MTLVQNLLAEFGQGTSWLFGWERVLLSSAKWIILNARWKATGWSWQRTAKVCEQTDSFQKVISNNGVLLPTSMSVSSRTALDLRAQSPHAADRWNGFGQSYNPGPECTGWNTHIALVAGVQVWSCGSFASENICCLLHLEAAVIQSFV